MEDDNIFTFLPLTLSMKTIGGLAIPLIRRGTPLPSRRTHHFSTAVDNQTAVSMMVYFGESPIAEKNMLVAKIELNKIPEKPRGEPQINTTFEIDQHCRIKITAKEEKSGRSISSEVEEAHTSLTKEKIEEMLSKANEERKEDEETAQQIDSRNKAASVIQRAEKYIQAQQAYGVSNSTYRQIEETLANLGLSVQDDNIGAIRNNTSRLERLLPDASFGGFGNLFGVNIFDDVFGSFTGRQKPQASDAGIPRKKPPSLQRDKKEQPAKSEEVVEDKRGLFSAGQQFDAKCVVRDLFAQATHGIVVIDAYVGEDVLNLLTVKREGVVVKLLTSKVSPALLTLAQDFNRQYKGLEIRASKAFHDRFIIVDNRDCYHFGASLEHLGNKAFMFSKISEPAMTSTLKKQWLEAWDQATQKL